MISVLVPFTPGCPHRDAAWEFLRPRWEQFGEVIEGRCDGPWVKALAVRDALSKASGDTLIIPDADVWCDPTEALEHLDTWAVPHLRVHRLSEDSTRQMIAGADWRRLPLDRSNRQDSKPYKGIVGGGITIIRRDVLFDVPPDVRFVGWGREDNAWGTALTRLVGKPWRGSQDLVHLWHPPQPRPTRSKGAAESEALWRRYRNARTSEQMRALVDESKGVA